MEQQKMAVRKKNMRLSFILLSIVVCFFFGIMLKVMLIGHGGAVSQSTARPKYYVARYSGFAPQLDLQVESARSACSHAARNPDYALAVLARWNVRAKENGAVEAGRHDLLRCAGSLARRFADRTVSSLRSVRLVFWSLVTVVQRSHETRPASVIFADFAPALA